MQDITTSILQKEQSYLSRIDDLEKTVAEQAEKLSCSKRQSQEYQDVMAVRQEAEQMMLQASARAAQADMDMQRAELMLHGAEMKLHNAQFKMDEANSKMTEASKVMESARRIKQETQHLVTQLSSYQGALKECSQSVTEKLRKIEAQTSPLLAAFPLHSIKRE
jgi:cell fate regulator YaaT (PSP1 superfamily)